MLVLQLNCLDLLKLPIGKTFMLFTKHAFFVLLLGLIIFPFLVAKVIWLTGSEKAMGMVTGIGHYSGMGLGESSYSLVEFPVGKKIISFHGGEENLKEGDKVAVRYSKNNPEDARLDTMLTMMESLSYMYALLIFWLVLYIMPDLIPKNAKIMVGSKPFLKIIKQGRK